MNAKPNWTVGSATLEVVLSKNLSGIKYEELMGKVLETPMVWESDLKEWLTELREQGKIEIPELTGRRHVPKKGDTILPLRQS